MYDFKINFADRCFKTLIIRIINVKIRMKWFYRLEWSQTNKTYTFNNILPGNKITYGYDVVVEKMKSYN